MSETSRATAEDIIEAIAGIVAAGALIWLVLVVGFTLTEQ